MGRLPDALFRRAIEFFLMAGESGRDGGLPRAGGYGLAPARR